jgi:DNA replication protein DnaC
MIVDAAYLARDNRRLARLLKDAGLRISGACLEDVDASAARGADRGMLRELATCSWVGDVLVTGPTGVGKSYLASALGHVAAVEACACSTAACRGSSTSE